MYCDTIVAQCTPSGTGALALIRISGPQAINAIGASLAHLSSRQTLSAVPTHTIHHGYVVDTNNDPIDEVMFFVMHAPRTFTGEQTLEISCHNNPFIINAIIARAIQAGARLAQPGEFSRQALENGKMNLMQAEGIKELIHAQTQEALKISLQQISGSLSARMQTLEKPLLQAIALCEASFEFLEEDMSFYEQICELLTITLTEIQQLTLLFDQQKQIRDGIRIALIGSVNAGKSSLFNALIGKNRAIVTSIAGTTRDSIEYGLYEQGHYWTVVDTAGLRITQDTIEQEGIERSYQEARGADLILLVLDGTRHPRNPEELALYRDCINRYPEKTILVVNKIDQMTDRMKEATTIELVDWSALYASAQTGSGITELKQHIAIKIAALFDSTTTSCPFLLNKRHYNLLLSCQDEITKAQEILSGKAEYELISLHLQKALALLSELTGKSITQNAMDAIFKDFCVGK